MEQLNYKHEDEHCDTESSSSTDTEEEVKRHHHYRPKKRHGGCHENPMQVGKSRDYRGVRGNLNIARDMKTGRFVAKPH